MYTILSTVRIRQALLISGLVLIHSFTYLFAIIQYRSTTGYYPAQLSQATRWVMGSSRGHDGIQSYLVMLFCTGLTLLIIHALLIRMMAAYGTIKKNRHDNILPILFCIPLVLECFRCFKPTMMPSYFVHFILIAGVVYSLMVIAHDTWRQHKKYVPKSVAISESALPLFYMMATTATVAALTNIGGAALCYLSLAKIHGMLSAFSYILFFAFVYTLRNTSWIAWLCLVLSAVCVVLFFSTDQCRHSSTITPHFLYEFSGFGLFYIAFIIQTIRVKID